MSRAISNQLRSWIAYFVVVFSTAIAAAENTIIDSFDYDADTSIPGQWGGSGWDASGWSTQNGAGTITASAGTLTYPNLPNTPLANKMLYEAPTGSTNSTRRFETRFTSGTVYVSFIWDSLAYIPVGGSSEIVGGRFAGLALYGQPTGGGSLIERMLLGQGSQPNGTPGNAPWIGMNRAVDNGSMLVGSLGVSAAADFLPAGRADVETLVVAKIEFDAGGAPTISTAGYDTDAELITLWLNPDLSLPEGANAPIGGSAFKTTLDIGEFGGVRIGGGGTNANGDYAKHVLDEIRISDVSLFAPTPIIPGDFNENGKVDAADYVVWRKGEIPPSHAGETYDDFRAHFGEGFGGAGVSVGGSVPEPASFVLLGLALGGAMTVRRHRSVKCC